MKTLLRKLLLGIARTVGIPIIDQRTGEMVGRVLIFGWNGRLHVIGLPNSGEVPELTPRFRPQERMTFYSQQLEFLSHPEPDFSHERGPRS